MNTMQDYLDTIKEEQNRAKMDEIFQWIKKNFPTLEFRIAWNQPIYTQHGTFIIGFSVAKKHLAVSPEVKGIQVFLKDIEHEGYTYGTNLFRIKWTDKIKYSLLKDIIQYNIEDKADCTSFWRT